MSKKSICLALAIVIVGTIFVSAYLASAAPPQGKGNDRVLSKIKFIHYKKGYGKPEGTPGKGNNNKDSECYEFLRKGVKWLSPVSLVVHPALEEKVDGAIGLSRETWREATPEGLFGSYEISDDADWDDERDQTDGRNELSFGDYPQDGVIAVTVVWGYFGGPPDQREIIEFDILFDTDFNWGNAGPTNEGGLGDTDFMDLENIATHELGHGLGLGDIYTDTCSEVTMYGYSTEGETKKRTLEGPDIAGIQELYGAP
jgi:hypothetical protein